MSNIASNLDLEGRWPELFDGLTTTQRRSVVQSFAGIWHEGWIPNRDDVQLLTDQARGTIDSDEYRRRALELARSRAAR